MSVFVALLLAAAALVAVGCSKDEDPQPSSEPSEEPMSGSAFGRQLRMLDIVDHVDTIIPVQNPAGYAELYRVTFTQTTLTSPPPSARPS